MRSLRSLSKLALLLAIVAMTCSSGLAQGPLHKQVNFSINVPYRMRMQNYMLPPGDYVLYQISANDLNLFALYQHDKRRSPIAMIRTVRRIHNVDYPDHTVVTWKFDESSTSENPVVTGWEIPGEDGWQVIAVVPRGRGKQLLSRIR